MARSAERYSLLVRLTVSYHWRMSERFRALLAEWKAVDQRASEAQAELNAKFQAFIDGTGPEPTEEDRTRVEKLRTLAASHLELALSYVKSTARGPNSGKGDS